MGPRASAAAGGPPRPWTLLDTLGLAAVTATAGLVRVMTLSRPAGFVFDELYATDACWYFYGSESLCMTDVEITAVHPPLGKWLIGVGIRIFGFSPGGWRIAAAVAGTLTVACLYLLGRKVLGSTIAAVVASGSLALDFLHVVLSRTAMLDVFVTAFTVAAFLFFAYDRAASLKAIRRQAGWGLGRPWRLAAGLAAGAAAATKWSGWPVLAAIIVLTVAQEAAVRRRAGTAHGLAAALREEGTSIFLALLALPLLVYAVSYSGRLEGTLLALPWSEGSWIGAFLERQRFMLDFHLGLEGRHPYASPAWSWLALKRPVLFYFAPTPEGGYQEILATGNPLVWWTSIPALVYVAAGRAVWLRPARWLILGGFLAGLVPWLLLGGAREQTFLYLVLPAVPFMCLGLGAAAAVLARSRIGVAAVGSFMVATVALFLFYRPLLLAEPLSYQSWRQRMLFTDCDQDAQKLHPQTRPRPPPPGWCWV